MKFFLSEITQKFHSIKCIIRMKMIFGRNIIFIGDFFQPIKVGLRSVRTHVAYVLDHRCENGDGVGARLHTTWFEEREWARGYFPIPHLIGGRVFLDLSGGKVAVLHRDQTEGKTGRMMRSHKAGRVKQ